MDPSGLDCAERVSPPPCTELVSMGVFSGTQSPSSRLLTVLKASLFSTALWDVWGGAEVGLAYYRHRTYWIPVEVITAASSHTHDSILGLDFGRAQGPALLSVPRPSLAVTLHI